MKYIKMLSLLAVAAAALMAFAASASATTITSPTGTAYTSTIKGESENGHVKLVGPLNINIQCSSTVEGTVSTHGSGVTAEGNISHLTFTGCTNGYTAQVINGNFGSLEIHALGGGEGTLTSKNTEVTVTTPLGFNCIYKTAALGTDIGKVTDSHKTGDSTATLHINAVTIPRTGHSAFCGASGEWNGNYKVTSPDKLYID